MGEEEGEEEVGMERRGGGWRGGVGKGWRGGVREGSRGVVGRKRGWWGRETGNGEEGRGREKEGVVEQVTLKLQLETSKIADTYGTPSA